MKPSVEIIRLEENFKHGTFGVLRVNKELFCVTLEPRDEENRRNVSSIPAQQYLCKLSPTALQSVRKLGFETTYEVTNVPGRSGIKFHPGNTIDDTAGCIIVGEHFGKLGKDRAVLNSGATFIKFMQMMDGADFILTIHEFY